MCAESSGACVPPIPESAGATAHSQAASLTRYHALREPPVVPTSPPGRLPIRQTEFPMTDVSILSSSPTVRQRPGRPFRTVPRSLRIVAFSLVAVAVCACGGNAQQSELVISTDRELRELASALLPALAEKSGLELREPVRLEMRTREELVRYLTSKLDEELPAEEARATVDAYALLGLVDEDLDLHAVLMALYTEQVAGFYEPDSTALFVMDDQPQAALQGLLVHELVHAVQDQWADLDALTDPIHGNDQATAAQAAIEGHATLVMLEYMTEQMQGSPVDLSTIPNFADQLRPALQGMTSQFPALASAPAILQEALLFPYLEGAGWVQRLWVSQERVAPFGEFLPLSTEQILGAPASDVPVRLTLTVTGGEVIHDDVLGRLELGVLLEEHLGDRGESLAEGWGGDRYALIESGNTRGLAWLSVWDDVAARDRFAAGFEAALPALGAAAELQNMTIDGHPGVLLRVGLPAGVAVAGRAGGDA